MPAYKLKAFPIMPRNPLALTLMQSCLFILAANWCLQGMRGMDRKELGFRLVIETAAALALALLLARSGAAIPVAACTGLALAHSLSFAFNGQVWVCARYCRFYRNDPQRLARYQHELRRRLRSLTWLDEAALIGSQAHGTPSARSDIDLRLVVPPGPAGWLRANLLLLRLRAGAFLRALPLDAYAYDAPASLERFDQREPLLPILDRHGRLAAMFASRIRA